MNCDSYETYTLYIKEKKNIPNINCLNINCITIINFSYIVV